MTVHGKYRLALLGQGNGVPLRGVIFDMDGTLTKPQTWMFAEMRKQLSVPDGVVILDYLLDIPDGPLREEAEGKIRAIEERAMHEQEPTLGLKELFLNLRTCNVKTSICTKNVAKPVDAFCSKFLKDRELVTGPTITRNFYPPKPSPKPLLHIIDSWGVSPHQVLMVGDSREDMQAGLEAGCAVVLLRHEDNGDSEAAFAVEGSKSKLDGIVTDFFELYKLLQDGIVVDRI